MKEAKSEDEEEEEDEQRRTGKEEVARPKRKCKSSEFRPMKRMKGKGRFLFLFCHSFVRARFLSSFRSSSLRPCRERKYQKRLLATLPSSALIHKHPSSFSTRG